MMVLNTTTTTGPPASSKPSSSIHPRMGKPPGGGRRFRSRGTIAGFGSSVNATNNPEQNGADNISSTTDNASSSANAERNVPQHAADSSTPPAKPCHSAWLALLSTQNALRMGAKTQLGLCPPGRSRRSLQQALRNKKGPRRSRQPSMRFDSEMTAYFGIDKMLGAASLQNEEDYLSTTNTFDVESDEEASSGDEDELWNIEEIITPDTATSSLDDEKKYASLHEPLFNPVGAELSPNQKVTSSPSSTTPGKLPFNRRKLRYFDSVTASDSARARAYLSEEAKKCKQRDGVMLARHLRRMQRRELRRLQLERGETPDFENSDDENEDPQEAALLKSGVAQFKEPMTASMAAALVLESLSLNPKESIEGMAKCYDGIVAAGVALLDSQILTSADDDKPRPRRSVIMAALEPLLITSLEQPSGEVILQLAKLRRMCGTPRYQRRFVQRVAPCLVRPPHAAMWCLQHQNDMEPILAAVEMIFDSAFDSFKKGWYQRGKDLLADSLRKDSLNTAAEQLKNLSSVPEGGPGLALNSTGHGMRRPVMMKGGTPVHDGSGRTEGNAPLAEWEVIAVDRQIRISISNILSNDWSRVAIVSKDVETALKNRRPGSNIGAPTLARSRSGGEASPKSVPSSPVSPKRTATPPGKAPLSPPSPKAARHTESPPTENFESVFGPSFASQPPSALAEPPEGESGSAPPPPVAKLISPPMLQGLDEGDSISPHKGQIMSSSATPSTTKVSPSQTESDTNTTTEKSRTPPRSPSSPANEETVQSQPSSSKGLPQAASPVRGTQSPEEKGEAPQSASSSPSHPSFVSLERVERAPLSPSGSVASDAAHRAASSSGASVASSTSGTPSQPAHYRMLTSTAAERKRTVAACRALRAQISRFEEAFMQLHGRAPKGAAERAPLATTYAQYREWKRAIRADAACRIQALFRGARARWTLLRSNNPRIERVVMTRAGRASFVVTPPVTVDNKAEDAEIKRLSIPREIDAKESGRGPRVSSNARTNAPAQPSFDEAFPTSTASASFTKLAPQWSTPGRRTSGGTASTPPPYASPQGSPSPTGYHQMSLPELQARKKELKQQLKQYDMNFARQHGRMPVKSEKEPIRHLYENYNSLKTQINMMEQEGQHLPPSVVQAQRPSPRSRSPPLAMVSGPDSSDESPPPSAAVVRPTRRKPSRPSPPLAESAPASAPSAAPSQDLAALKAEKQQLHQMLRSYEKDFFREHKRQVSSFADIKPVASQYRRYKEIKKAIATLQQKERER